MSFHRTDGGVSRHALNRLFNQYKFKGSKKEARKLLRICRSIAVNEGVGKIEISSNKLGFPPRKFRIWNISGKKLIAVVSDKKVVSVID